MNFKKFINSDYLKSNPLCGIGIYKEELNLATGACTRRIKKLVLTGEETITKAASNPVFTMQLGGSNTPLSENAVTTLSTHYQAQNNTTGTGNVGDTRVCIRRGYGTMYIGDTRYDNATDFKIYLATQYAAGTPVTIWYVLVEPTTETIAVPSGLTGTVEGYLNQSGTPTPTNPIYPTANTVEQWFDLNHYIMGISTSGWHPVADVHERNNGAWV